jgi:hypothetical protein
MAERFIRVFSGKENLYAEGAPVIISASALLKDTENGNVIAQIKLRNLDERNISYVKVAITPFDALGAPLGDAVEFEYLDLSVQHGEDFGSKKALTLPSASTRSFGVRVCAVGFEDGKAWADEETDWIPAPSAVLKKMYADDVFCQALAFYNIGGKEYTKEALELFKSICDDKDVSVEIELCEKELAEIEENEIQAEREKAIAKKKTKKAAIIICVALVAIAVISALGYFVAYPTISYLGGDYKVYIDMYGVEDFEIPDGVTSISERAFENCFSLPSITIPDSITSIGEDAFYACDSLEKVTIGNGVTSIGSEAFWDCSSLTSITIPDSVTSIGRFAFYSCSSLTSITYKGTVAQWNAISKGFNWINYMSGSYTIHCTDGDISE